MQELFIVIDNGGTNIKTVLIDLAGNQIEKVSFSTPRIENEFDFREVDMNVIWDNIALSIKELITKANVLKEHIVGVATVGHGKGLYLLDKNGDPVRNGILSTDNRASSLVMHLKQKTNEINMQPILSSQAPVLLRWLKENEKDNYLKTEHILSAKDYVRYKLTDKVYTDYSDASSNNLMDINKKEYDQEIFKFFEITELYSKVPEIVNSTDICGHITEKAANETGLPVGIPVIGGMFDIDASALSTNVLSTDYISVTAGTWSINEYLAVEPVESNNNILNSIFVDNNYYLIESSSPTSAGNLDIIIDCFVNKEFTKMPISRSEIYQLIAKNLKDTDSETTNTIFLPFLYGSNDHPDAKGCFIGLDSTLNFTQMVRAVYEGVAFSHRYHLEKLLEQKRTPTKGIRLAGGIVNSDIWVQILADVLKYPIEIVESKELGALGGAIALSVGLNYFDSFSEAAASMTKIKKVFYPNSKESNKYDEKYAKYSKIISSLNNIW
ncbi:FGGY-family carbohydrate kinase [Bacillus sp. FJAT-50079]|uniref:FGGY-family carbohydrate kinase n=1 Tax=Bacillus sp. FJAT-50079 TaxID=2833577 RepID=UPI001BCA1331|nr:FGGY-family carbohydrate kinase [Bacillus sp. FJAT-50079]MBS4208162.1 carbohydrate kinase [Bacillus sp. FJAT-50079]